MVVRCGGGLVGHGDRNYKKTEPMGWLRDRFSRTMAYHYHKKAIQRAIKNHTENDCTGRSDADGVDASTTNVPASDTTFCYERIVGEDDIHYRAKVQLTFTPKSIITTTTAATTATTTATSATGGTSSDSDRYRYMISGVGTETCLDDVAGRQQRPEHQTFTVRDGQLAASTGSFYWTEVRRQREKHLVIGTMRRDHWDASVWRVEDAYYIKRYDKERYGIPVDGDIRETILSFASVPSSSIDTTQPEQQQQQPQQQQQHEYEQPRAETVKLGENEGKSINAQESIGKPSNDDGTDIQEIQQTRSKKDEGNANEENAINGDSTEIIIHSRKEEEHQTISTDSEEKEFATPENTITLVDLDESVSQHDDTHNTKPNLSCTTTLESGEEVPSVTIEGSSIDEMQSSGNGIPPIDITKSTSPVQDQFKDGQDNNAFDYTDEDNFADAIPDDCIVPSLLPHIREARSLIDKLLGKEEINDGQKALTITNATATEAIRYTYSDDSSLLVDYHDFDGDKHSTIPITIDKSVFQEDGEEDGNDDDEHNNNEGNFLFDKAAFYESDEEENCDIEMVFSEESLQEEKEVLHTEVQRINKTFEFLSSQHHGKNGKGNVD